MKNLILIALSLACASIEAQASPVDVSQVPREIPALSAPARTIEIEFLHNKTVQFADIKIEKGLLVVDVEFMGRKLVGLIDTGSDATIVDSTLLLNDSAAEIGGVETILKGWGGISKAKYLYDADVKIADQIRVQGTLISADLSKIREMTGINFSVIVGMDVLDESSFILDLKKNRIFLTRSGALKFDRSRWDSATMIAGVIQGNLNGQDVKLKIDTGSSSSLLVPENKRRRIFGELALSPLLKASVDISGRVSQDFGIRGAIFEFLGSRFNGDVRITEVSAERFDGYLGLKFFEDKVTIFDFAKNQIMLSRPHLSLRQASKEIEGSRGD